MWAWICSRRGGTIAALLALGAVGCDGTSGPLLTHKTAALGERRLIQFGSYVPTGLADMKQLAAQVSVMEQAPFDGLVLDLGLSSVWSGTRVSKAEIDPAAAVVRAAPFHTLATNFQRLKVAPVNWFDDQLFTTIAANARDMGLLARDAGLRGVMMDTQNYGAPVWDYNASGGHTFAEVQAKVQQRGNEFMAALMDGLPDLTVMFTLAYAETFRATCIAGEPLEQQRYALLPAFLDGMVLAQRNRGSGASLVDGFLMSYPARSGASFPAFRDLIHGKWDAMVMDWIPGLLSYAYPEGDDPWAGLHSWPDTPRLLCSSSDRTQLNHSLEAGFGIMLDYEDSKRGGFFTRPADFAQNYRTPDQVEDTFRGAFQNSDRFVWIWTSSVQWWPFPGSSLPLVPDPYVQAVRQARH